MRTAVLFPGQGSQEVGMGLAAYESSSAAKAVFDEADSLLDFPLSELAFTGPEEALTDTVNQQPALLTASIANLNKELSLAMKTNAQTAMAPPQPNTSTNPTQQNITQSNIAVT